ncbi:plasmid segregation protein ParM domain-containing protein [Vibrio barjaei]|uniref:plasmid segregation protein ParM domain-containing protein n=1 Tax=Vibrio barjaei TaxID=1676683 RepID=UPI002284DD47|nr:plasmid segregation protein ParM domain-containing protein [Vibrio barjaei]MCY9872358.1 plasmid segregation protein ParM [Vibrio barjaei]
MDLIISVDDGSTQQKLSWICPETGEIKTLVVPNSLRKGWKSAALRNDTSVFNFFLDDKRYTYDETSEQSLDTQHVDYQWSDENLISVHYALLQTGIDIEKYKNIKLICTLPITQYYRKEDNQFDEDNIARKKANLMRPVELNEGKTFNVVDVKVMPESAPACMSILLDPENNITNFHRTLIVDLGGTTLDLAVVKGAFKEVSEVMGNSELGVSWVTRTAMTALANAHSHCSFLVANELIKNRHDESFVRQVIVDHTQVDTVLKKIDQSIIELGEAVAQACARFTKSPNMVLLVGGGSSLVVEAVKNAYPALGDRVMLVEGAESMLAVENMKMHSKEAKALYEAA